MAGMAGMVMTKDELLLLNILGNQSVIMAALGVMISNPTLSKELLDRAETIAKLAADGMSKR